ncbi:MAG: CBS domain-containing protein [Candidatus Micrarchaeota archaeon]|nr:CBS domain-containing protein [Candidatus Micrarchaeota archaeon]
MAGLTAKTVTIGDITTRHLVSIQEDETVEKAGNLMQEKEVTMLVVMEKEKVVGILTAGQWFNSFYLHVGSHLPHHRFRTDRAGQFDLQLEKSEAVKKRAAEFKQMKISEIMSSHFKTISENASLVEAVHEMKSSEIRRLLVTDEKSGKIIGVLGRTRTINALLSEL